MLIQYLQFYGSPLKWEVYTIEYLMWMGNMSLGWIML